MKTLVRPALLTAFHYLDLTIHREIARLRLRYQLSLDEFKGLYVSDQQVNALLSQSQGGEQWSDIGMDELEQQLLKAKSAAKEALATDHLWQHFCQVFTLNGIDQAWILIALAPEMAIFVLQA
ncbi:MAG: hypothetical protein AAFZ92_09365, partial [Pseudomonadota bacterium]